MNEFAEPLPPIGDDYTLRYLTPDDGPAIQQLCERSGDYFDVITGLPPGPAEAQSLFVALPEGSSYEDKALIGVFAPTGTLIGVMDAVRNAPEPGEWWLGALLLDPEWRNRGLGARLYHAFEWWAGAMGAQGVHLSVVEPNMRALKFWQRLGFGEIERHPPHLFGAKVSATLILRRSMSDKATVSS